jgi:hypothetical protein
MSYRQTSEWWVYVLAAVVACALWGLALSGCTSTRGERNETCGPD